MGWRREEIVPNSGGWQIPQKEIVIHEETSAAEDLNVYPENISLLPELVQHGKTVWMLDNHSLDNFWQADEFYSQIYKWLNYFYLGKDADSWNFGFYALSGGWSEDASFYIFAPSQWVPGFYAVPMGWEIVPDFYTNLSFWSDLFYFGINSLWVNRFYIGESNWYIENECI